MSKDLQADLTQKLTQYRLAYVSRIVFNDITLAGAVQNGLRPGPGRMIWQTRCRELGTVAPGRPRFFTTNSRREMYFEEGAISMETVAAETGN